MKLYFEVWGNRMAPLTAEEVRRRFEALESRQEATLEELKCSNEKVAYWMERAERAEKLLQPSCQEPASEESGSESEAAEGPAEAAAPPAALKEGQGPVTDSSDGEGFETQNRRRKRKRTRPMSSSEEESRVTSDVLHGVPVSTLLRVSLQPLRLWAINELGRGDNGYGNLVTPFENTVFEPYQRQFVCVPMVDTGSVKPALHDATNTLQRWRLDGSST
ncbi:hypothetical protein HUJ05_001782 [Dendroctonus ponderosae]|nr:hypothetical protein HUJ05_001782 [Dendroctonus ponderosae]